MRFLSFPLLTAFLFALTACSPEVPDVTDPKPPDTTDPSDDNPADCQIPTLGGACDMSQKIGSFTVVHEEGHSVLSGEIADGLVPATTLQKLSESGDCVLLWQVFPECDPACPSGTTCDYDGTCIPYPSPLSVGTVVVNGLKQSAAMEPTAPGNTYSDIQLPHPAVDPGACVELVAEGGDIAGFTLHGAGVTPLEIPDEPWVLRYDQPLTVSWTPATDDQSRIVLELSIDEPGIWPATLVCNVEDSGSFTVPAEMVNAFLDYGFTDLAEADIYRQTTDSTETTNGCVEFKVISHREVVLQVE